MWVKPLVGFVIVFALLPACNLFGVYQLESSLPTTQMELTLSEKSPDANVAPEYDAVEAKSKDGQIVRIDITLFFKIDPMMGDQILKKWGEDYIMSFLVPTLRQTIEEAIGEYTARQIYGQGRLDLINTLQTTVNKNISAEGFIFSDVLVRNITFEATFVATVESEYVSAQRTALAEPKASPTP